MEGPAVSARVRPEPVVVLAALFDDQIRLSSMAKRHMVAQVRCKRKLHLVAFVVATAHGPLAAWRTPPSALGQGALGGKWQGAWLDFPMRERAWCTDCRQSWSADLTWLSQQSGTIFTDQLARWTAP